MHSALRAILRSCGIVGMTILYFPIVLPCWQIAALHTLRDWLVSTYWANFCRIAGIRVKVLGKIEKQRPLMLISNHCSYCDVFVLGSIAPMRFTPKSQVENWPIIGLLCKMSGCIFIDRRRKKTEEQLTKVEHELSGGTPISIFPEGTTNQGDSLLTFRSPMFSLAENTYNGKNLTIQPATVAYRRMNGLPLTTRFMPWVAWYGDMDFFPHFWNLLQVKSLEVVVQFHPAYAVTPGQDRKKLAAQMQLEIAAPLKKLRQERKLEEA